ncbi:SLC13 family permease [Algoriphagus aestuariicola]|uniref:SLC13 family permease n=1 Tax=Algoriphagus aestuariicola TaxID=1852016 RepID=UPI00293D34EE|nr:SLC13 family permease [Algoriphagus aestuariicola]
MNFSILFVCLVIFLLVLSLYNNWLRPALAFVIASMTFVVFQILSIEDLLAGLANKQIIVIFLLVTLTAGIQQNLGKDFFYQFFGKHLSPFQFRARMMVLVSSLSSLLNNTPIVAFMIPFVKNWADENGYSASKFLIPLSFATILGGMITVVGTSTNLVLNGLIEQSGLQGLGYRDFLFLGVIVSVLGLIYLTFASDFFLKDRKGNKEQVIGHLNEYLVETKVERNSSIIGKTIETAGLRHLKELFLVELKRGERTIPAVGSSVEVFEGDYLFFAGNTQAILNLINSNNGLVLPDQSQIHQNGFSSLSEAIIPTGSNLVGQTLRDSGFRDRYKASVISIYRKGEKVKGNLGETKLQAGDFLLMICAKDWDRNKNSRDLILISNKGELEKKKSLKQILPSIFSLGFLILGILGFMELFFGAFLGILVMVSCKILKMKHIKNSIDLELLIVLVCSLSIGVAIQKSGTAGFIVEGIKWVTDEGSPIFNIGILFLITMGLTSLITNAAAVSIMFPIALEMGTQSGGMLTPYFVAIAFAASADFMTPIGYQTNLMVMGPGNYQFSDYARIGLPLTIIYGLSTLVFINFYYF